MKRVVAVLAVLAVAGCAQSKKEPEVAAVDLASNLSIGCYTVDLFDPYQIQTPTPEVPSQAAEFLGVWKNGAWDGHWCHDLYVTAVHADGSAEVLDAYGPWRERNIEATVFKRRARIEDGHLTFLSQGGSIVKYRRDGNYLVGTRSAFPEALEIVMSRDGDVALTPAGDDRVATGPVPVPPRKPVRRS